jgi:hypothetical protein
MTHRDTEEAVGISLSTATPWKCTCQDAPNCAEHYLHRLGLFAFPSVPKLEQQFCRKEIFLLILEAVFVVSAEEM